MIKGKSLIDLAKEIERIENSKMDLVVPTDKLEIVPEMSDDSNPREIKWSGVSAVVENGDKKRFSIGDVAHEQLSDHYKIPRDYYRRCLSEAPELLAFNINRWRQKQPEQRLVRTLDGRMRAFLSDRFRPLDNYMVATASLPVLRDTQGMEVISCEITERRLYIQAMTPRIAGEVKVGDIVQAGVVISNSEVGCGSVRVEPMIYRLSCKNGMISSYSLKRYHVGKRLDANDGEVYEFYATETIEKDNEAFMLKMRDTVKAAFNEKVFQSEILKLQEATTLKIGSGKINDVVVEVTKRFNGLRKTDGDLILSSLVEGGDLSLYGLANAITSLANDESDYDRGIELERIGGQVITLPRSEWSSWNN